MPNHKSGSSVPYTLQRQKLQSDRIMVARTLLLAHLPCVFVTLYQPSNLHTKREFQISFKHPDHNPLACFSKDTRRNLQIYRTREAHIHFTATKEDQRNPLLKIPWNIRLQRSLLHWVYLVTSIVCAHSINLSFMYSRYWDCKTPGL